MLMNASVLNTLRDGNSYDRIRSGVAGRDIFIMNSMIVKCFGLHLPQVNRLDPVESREPKINRTNRESDRLFEPRDRVVDDCFVLINYGGDSY